MNKIAILLTVFNRKEKTLDCLEKLFTNEIPVGYQMDVFLVDDGSTDGTGEAIKSKFPSVNIIKGSGNLYWNRGMHLAWKEAYKNEIYDFYIWLNDDVALFQTAIKEIIAAANQQPLAVICGVTKSKFTNTITYGGRDFDGNLIIPNGKTQQAYLFNGNFVCIPKQIFLKVGNLDPFFIHSIGDYDYGLRVNKAGFKNFITPTFSGFCEKHDKLPNWCLKEVSLVNRFKNLYSPLGNSHPYYYTVYIFRHFGLLKAIKNLITIHIRVLFPSLWKQ